MGATVTEASAAPQKPAAQPTIGGSVYVKPQDIAWEPTQFEGISIKVLYEDKPKGEMTCLLKWEPGATLPMHKHPEIEQTFVIEGSFYDHDGVCHAGEFVWRRVGSFHETHSDEGAIIPAVDRKPNVFQHGSGYTAAAGRHTADPAPHGLGQGFDSLHRCRSLSRFQDSLALWGVLCACAFQA